jgi:hypothetical protein
MPAVIYGREPLDPVRFDFPLPWIEQRSDVVLFHRPAVQCYVPDEGSRSGWDDHDQAESQ